MGVSESVCANPRNPVGEDFHLTQGLVKGAKGMNPVVPKGAANHLNHGMPSDERLLWLISHRSKSIGHNFNQNK